MVSSKVTVLPVELAHLGNSLDCELILKFLSIRKVGVYRSEVSLMTFLRTVVHFAGVAFFCFENRVSHWDVELTRKHRPAG